MSDEESLPAVSVLLSTKDRRDSLALALESLRALDYPPEKVEIVVVEETDSPRDPGADRYVVLPREGKGFAWSRNAALRAASHPLVAFTDDDCRVDPRWLRELVAPFRDPEVAAVAGGVLAQPAGAIGLTEIVLGFPGGGLGRLARSEGEVAPTGEISTVNAAARREVLQSLGGFCEATGVYGGEDSELFGRLTRRHRAVFNPRALVYHRTRNSPIGIARWLYRRGLAAVSLARIDEEGRRAHLYQHLRNSLTIRLAALTIAIISWNLPPASSVVVLAALYYGFQMARYRFAWKALGLPVLLLTPITKMLMDFAFEAGRLHGFGLWFTGRLGAKSNLPSSDPPAAGSDNLQSGRAG